MKPILLLQLISAIITLLLAGIVANYVYPLNGWQVLAMGAGFFTGIFSIIVSLVSAYEK